MRIVSWNCNGNFREKHKIIQTLQADIYVIQECEDPKQTNNEEYKNFAKKHLWCGHSKNKGLGLFFASDFAVTENNWPKYCLRNFLSANINGQLDLVGVWACDPYIGEYYIYQDINYHQITDKTIILGDFNSNAIWDRKGKVRTHQKVVDLLADKGLCSAYHHKTGEEQGKETTPTFYQYRKENRGYHIDHCFLSPQILQEYTVAENAEFWLQYSDHIPLIVDIELSD